MKHLEITLARLNVKVSINRLLFRLKNEKMSDEKRTNIENEVNDLDYVVRLLDHLEQKHEQMFKDNRRLMQDVLESKRQIAELTAKKLEI
jgi:cell division septum initiation protein DivIVA